jgi:hypothetical protein
MLFQVDNLDAVQQNIAPTSRGRLVSDGAPDFDERVKQWSPLARFGEPAGLASLYLIGATLAVAATSSFLKIVRREERFGFAYAIPVSAEGDTRILRHRRSVENPETRDVGGFLFMTSPTILFPLVCLG